MDSLFHANNMLNENFHTLFVVGENPFRSTDSYHNSRNKSHFIIIVGIVHSNF